MPVEFRTGRIADSRYCGPTTPMYHPVDVHDSVQEIFLEAQTLLVDRAYRWAARRSAWLAERGKEEHRRARARDKKRPRWAWTAERGWFVK